jgi:hypothetical protein
VAVAVLGCAWDVARAAPAPDSTVVDIGPRSPWAAETTEAGPGHWFYRGLPYGSESLVHPVRLVVNGGLGILQFDHRSNRLDDVRFRDGWRRVWADLGNPSRAIKLEGWSDFLRREVLPFSLDDRGAQYWPNYTLHLVGGGMSFVMMEEWYEQHGIRHARAYAGVTLTAYHLLNEVVENDRRPGPTTDAIADLLIFDPAGVALFSHPGVAGFFSRRLHLSDWSGQPAIDPANSAIENQGQNFSIKLHLPRTDRWSLFYYFGNHGQGGLTYTLPDGSAFSAAAGLQARALVEIGAGVQAAELVPTHGIFYDRDGSLLFSWTSANKSRYRWRANAYPGLVRVRGWTVGAFALGEQQGHVVLGISLTALPVGVAGRW